MADCYMLYIVCKVERFVLTIKTKIIIIIIIMIPESNLLLFF